MLVDECDVVLRGLGPNPFGGGRKALETGMVVAYQLLGILMLQQLDALEQNVARKWLHGIHPGASRQSGGHPESAWLWAQS